ncbi:MAG: hypothetical protein R2748_16150 [Bryobacterales bacterium]
MAASDFWSTLDSTHVIEIERRGRAADAHLVLFRSGANALEVALDQKSRELFAIDLGEHGVDVRPAAVRDPHFLTRKDEMLAVLGQRGFGTRR